MAYPEACGVGLRRGQDGLKTLSEIMELRLSLSGQAGRI